MSETYLLTLNVSTALYGSSVTREGIADRVVSALHPAVIVEAVDTDGLASGIVFVVVRVVVANEAEARDSLERIRRAPGLPPSDAYTLRRV